MAASFQLKCLGLPELRGPDGKVIRFRVKKHIALLVYLAVERRGAHDRARLVEMFWPKAGTAKGRHSLATALSLLRSIFGRAAFGPGRATIRFSPGRLTLDLDRLSAGDVLGADGEAPLEVDGFLRGFDLIDAPEFGIWKDREHARRLPAIHSGLLTLIDHGRRRGSHDEVMERADRLLAIDHLAEEGIRAKIEALTLAGDRFSALRVFDEWKSQIKDEVGAEPSALLEGMAAQLRKRGWEPRAPVAITPVPAEQWRDRRFVGRGVEFRRLYEIWETTHQFRPALVHVTGDSGVGKTTLAQRLATSAGLEGASVARVQCYRLEQHLPYTAIGGMVEGLLGRPGASGTSPQALADLSRILPRVRNHFPTLPSPRPGDGEVARLLFAEAVIELLQAVMDERPTLLVFDDIHHADEASTAVLHLVLRRLPEGRYLVLATTPVQADARALGSGFGHGNPQRTAATIALQPLGAQESSDLLREILASAASRPRAPERRAIVRASGGYPMALELLAEDWRANGARSIAISLRAMTASFDLNLDTTDTYSDLADRVLQNLSESARQVATLAALLGSRAGDLSLYVLVDLTFGQTAEGVSELTTRRLVRSIGPTIEFTNEVVRAHIYNRIPTPVRRALHSAIADRLLADKRVGNSAPGLELAWHLNRSGRSAEATPHLLSGVAEAKAGGAPHEAILALESALPHVQPAIRPRITIALGDLHQELGQWADSLTVLGTLERIPAGLANMASVLATNAKWNLGLTQRDDHAALVRDLLQTVANDRRAAPTAYLLAARIAKDTADPTLMKRVLDSESRNLTDQRDHLPVILARALLSFHLRRTDAALVAALTALRAVRTTGRADVAATRLFMGIAVVYAAMGEYASSVRFAEEAIVMGQRLDNAALVSQVQSNAASSYLRLRRYQEAISLARTVQTHLPFSNGPRFLQKAFQLDALGNCLLGRTDAALDVLRRAESVLELKREGWLHQDWLLTKADILWHSRRQREAIAVATRATTGDYLNPMEVGFRGQHARWVATLGLLNGIAPSALDRIEPPTAEHSQLDALDHIEILGAILRLRRHIDRCEATGIVECLSARLALLDGGTVEHFRDMGFLEGMPAQTFSYD
ncbi:MAG: AAA family ATPase [Gemmatimonadales bacterium]